MVMNNEPVAWKVIETDDEGSFTTFIEVEPVWTDNATPLYTHPAKTLTDEEILDICIKFGFYDRISDPHFDDKTGAWSLDEDLIEFAKAILRKAQKK